MSWIREDRTGLPSGMVLIGLAMPINREAMEGVTGMTRGIFFGASAMTRMQGEAIAAVVSVINTCRYGTMRHGAALHRESDEAKLANHVMDDYTKADLDPQTRGMLDYAAKLTREPGSMREADMKRLRELGLSDEQILSMVLITAQFAFMTRLADGLGIDVPAETVEFVEGWLASPARDQQWLMEKHA